MVGASPIIALDPSEPARQRALDRGADHALDPTAEDVVARVWELTGGLGLDVAVDLYGANRVLKQANACLGRYGRLLLIGLCAEPIELGPTLTPAGQPLPVGTLLRNPDLAHTYGLIARDGARALYYGPIGRAVVQADDHLVLAPGTTNITRPGIMSMQDLRSYRTRVLAPTQITDRGLKIYGMAPLFQYLEASRLAYADRNHYVGDPRYVHVPLGGLLDPRFAALRRCQITSTALTSSVAPGTPFAPYPGCSTGTTQAQSASPEAHHTNNIVTFDGQGDIVAYTNTINFFGGSGQVVPGYGFLLNDEMTDFDFAPSSPGAYDPNLPVSGKQPRSSMGPVIATRHGRPVFAIGAAGGSTIITTVVQTLINHVDFGMPLPAALAAPRVSQSNSSSNTSLAEPDFYNSPLAQQLTSQFGEKFKLATGSILPLDSYPGDATALQILGRGRAQAIAEPVRLGGGSALAVSSRR